MTNLMLLIILSIAAGWFEAAREYLLFRTKPNDLAFLPFWGNPYDSWIRKYKHSSAPEGPAFPFSTTLLVWLTDGYHLMNTYTAWYPVGLFFLADTWWHAVGSIALQMLTMHVCFTNYKTFIPQVK